MNILKMTVSALLMVGVLVAGAADVASAAPTPEQKCQTAKLKALGKVRACLLKQRANVILGKDDESAECMTKFEAAIAKADLKATAAMTSCRYLDNGNSTLTDLDTGLMWEKKDDLGGVHDKDNSYTWSTSIDPNGTVFIGFLGTLNNGTSSSGIDTVAACFAGHCDWRLPTIQEYATIYTGGICGPCIDPAFGPTINDYYWSSTTVHGGSDYAWIGAFNGGFSTSVPKTAGPVYARAVRGGL